MYYYIERNIHTERCTDKSLFLISQAHDIFSNKFNVIFSTLH